MLGLNAENGEQLWDFKPEVTVWNVMPMFPDTSSVDLGDAVPIPTSPRAVITEASHQRDFRLPLSPCVEAALRAGAQQGPDLSRALVVKADPVTLKYMLAHASSGNYADVWDLWTTLKPSDVTIETLRLAVISVGGSWNCAQ